jgi:integrase/recombinase XerD
MLTDGKHRPGSVKMGYYALRFLFCNIYHKEWAKAYLPTPKVAKTLPLVLAKEEVEDVLGVIRNFKYRTVIMFIYSTGARVSECVNIRLTDIDSKRGQVNIQEGKGLKQRKVPLSPVLLNLLRSYFKKYKPQHYLFEGAGGKGTHLGVAAVREICKKARYATPRIKKAYTPHTFRHCFATHHLEGGTNLLVIQRLLGHADLSNTLKYLHVQQLNPDQVVNPLDRLNGVEGLCKDK